MTVLERHTQSADEKLRYGIDYSPWLEAGETVDSFTFDVTPTTSPALEVTEGEIITNNALIFFVSGGVSGTKYEVTANVVTSLGQERSDEIIYELE